MTFCVEGWSPTFRLRLECVPNHFTFDQSDDVFNPPADLRFQTSLSPSSKFLTALIFRSAILTFLPPSIDGVLVRSAEPIPRAKEALSFLQSKRIPFILLTNGGGKHESERVAELGRRLGVPLDTGMFVQSHTPFASLVQGNRSTPPQKDKCNLVVGGEGDNCRRVAET